MRSSHQNCWYVSTFYKLFLSFSMVVTLVYEPEETIGEIREQQIKKGFLINVRVHSQYIIMIKDRTFKLLRNLINFNT